MLWKEYGLRLSRRRSILGRLGLPLFLEWRAVEIGRGRRRDRQGPIRENG